MVSDCFCCGTTSCTSSRRRDAGRRPGTYGVAVGMMVVARCRCGCESSQLTIGAGMLTFKERCWWPAWCESCFEVVTADVMASRAACERCGQDVELFGEVDSTEADVPGLMPEWSTPDGRHLSLANGPAYRCRICDRDALAFQITGDSD